MRSVVIGAGSIGMILGKLLLKESHEVVMIESDKEKIEDISDQLDCGILHGDGSKPGILKEANPPATDALFCLTGNDHVNIIAGLIGQSLGFKKVVVKIEDVQFEHICMELGLENLIIPARTTARWLADMFHGQDLLELSAMIKENARVFSFVVGEEDRGSVEDLDLPDQTRVMCLYRDNEFLLPETDTQLRSKDELVVVTHSKNLSNLQERWGKQRVRR